MVRNVWARAAVASAVLMLLAGCGSSEGAEGRARAASPAGTQSVSASPSAPVAVSDSDSAAKPLTKTQLANALLKQGDLEGRQVKDLASPIAEGAPVDADEDACAAVAMMTLFALSTDPVARVARAVSARSGDTAGVGTSVLLSSYQGADAKTGMADLKESVAGCPGGFDLGDDLKVSAVQALEAPDLWDETVAFRLNGGILGADTPTAYTVVRSGSTLAVFFAVDMTNPKAVRVPDEVVTAQLSKLEKVEKSVG